MAHAGTMDLGRGVQTKQGGEPRPLVALMVAGIVAIVAVVWLATGFGQAGGATTTLIESRTEAMNEARAAGTLSIDTSLKGIPYVDTLSAQEYIDNILDRAHATPFVETVAIDALPRGIPYVDTLSAQEYLDNILDRAHATPFVETVKPDHNR